MDCLWPRVLEDRQRELGMTDTDLAFAAATLLPASTRHGIHPSAISNWRRAGSTRVPSLGQLLALCEALGLTDADTLAAIRLLAKRDLRRRLSEVAA